MPKVRLEFEELTINKSKKRWKLYFVIVAQHPEDEDKYVVTLTPDPLIRVKRPANNVVDFEPEGVGVDGFFILEREMPADRSIDVRVYLRHSRKSVRNVGDFLQEFGNKLGDENTFGTITDILGSTGTPWLVIAKAALPLLGGILSKIKDRDFGFLSAAEEFGPEFDDQEELDRTNNFSTGQATLTWSWSINE